MAKGIIRDIPTTTHDKGKLELTELDRVGPMDFTLKVGDMMEWHYPAYPMEILIGDLVELNYGSNTDCAITRVLEHAR